MKSVEFDDPALRRDMLRGRQLHQEWNFGEGDAMDRGEDRAALFCHRRARSGETFFAQDFRGERLTCDSLGDIGGAEAVVGLENRAHARGWDAGLDCRDHQARIFLRDQMRRDAGQRIVLIVGAWAGELQDELRALTGEVGVERPGRLVRAARQPLKVVDRSRRSDVTHDCRLQACAEIFSAHFYLARAPYSSTTFRSLKNPNRYCATRRIWISSEPSVMR